MKKSYFQFILLFLCYYFLFQIVSPGFGAENILLSEPFEDTNYASRGWYDSTGGTLSESEYVFGSTKSLECRFFQGQTTCNGGVPGRHLFSESDSLYIRYHVKYSENWTGSNLSYWPHEFYVLTNKNSQWTGPAYTRLTFYIEQNEGEPLLAIQDGQNIDESKVGQNLSEITEQRAVAGCNGDSDGYGNGTCYPVGSIYYNGKFWRAGAVYFQDTPGSKYKSDWHLVEVYFKLNSVFEGKGLRNGIIKYWYDGNLLIDYNNVVMRTGQYPDMKFNQLIVAPYMGASPIDQTFWVDNLIVATERSSLPNAPMNLRIIE